MYCFKCKDSLTARRARAVDPNYSGVEDLDRIPHDRIDEPGSEAAAAVSGPAADVKDTSQEVKDTSQEVKDSHVESSGENDEAAGLVAGYFDHAVYVYSHKCARAHTALSNHRIFFYLLGSFMLEPYVVYNWFCILQKHLFDLFLLVEWEVLRKPTSCTGELLSLVCI